MRLADQISLRSRRRKFGLFMESMAPTSETTVLDVGVDDFAFGEVSANEGSCGTLNFFEEMYPWPAQLTAVGQHEGERFRSSYPDARYVRADALELPFEDGAFDIVFSNAVIEHVGSRQAQRRFVSELCRVAPRVFLSTPNRWFPVETHTLVPLVHWLPRPAADRAMRALRREDWERVELLGKTELLALFPPEANARVVESRLTISAVAARI